MEAYHSYSLFEDYSQSRRLFSDNLVSNIFGKKRYCKFHSTHIVVFATFECIRLILSCKSFSFWMATRIMVQEMLLSPHQEWWDVLYIPSKAAVKLILEHWLVIDSCFLWLLKNLSKLCCHPQKQLIKTKICFFPKCWEGTSAKNGNS